MALRATPDPGRSGTGEKRAGGPGEWGPGWVVAPFAGWVPGVAGTSAGSRTPGWFSGCLPVAYPRVRPWHWPYVRPEPHQQLAPDCGGQATARPLAASVVAYCGSSVASFGDESSDAANAS